MRRRGLLTDQRCRGSCLQSLLPETATVHPLTRKPDEETALTNTSGITGNRSDPWIGQASRHWKQHSFQQRVERLCHHKPPKDEAVLVRSGDRGAVPLQPIEQSLTAQAWRHPWQGLALQRQNRNFEVVTGAQLRINSCSIDIDHIQTQRWPEAIEVKLPKALFQSFTEATALPAEQDQLHGLNRGRGHSRRE